jgi:hypothetical protein
MNRRFLAGVAALLVGFLPLPGRGQQPAAPSPQLLVRTGSTEFTTPGGEMFTQLAIPAVTDAGAVVFRGGAGGVGVYRRDADLPLAEIVAAGAQAPGAVDGAVFSNIFSIVGAGAGRAAFIGRVEAPGLTNANDNGIWTNDDDGVLRKVMQAGDPVAPLGAGVYFNPILSPFEVQNGPDVIRHAVNAAGEVVFTAGLNGPNARDVNDRGLFLRDPNALSVLARRGDPVPGTGDGAVFANFLRGRAAPSINDRGDVAFQAGFELTTRDQGLFLRPRGGELQLFARTGDEVPGAGGGVTWKYLSDPNLNNAGQLAFQASLQGPAVGPTNSRAIVAGRPDDLQIVARSGDLAPGTLGSFLYFGNGPVEGYEPPLINAAGHAAFVALLSGPGVTPYNDSGLWAQDPSGQLQLIAREGDPAPGGGDFNDFIFSDMQIQLGAGGHVAFATTIGPNVGLWATGPDKPLMQIAREASMLEFETSNGSETQLITRLSFPLHSGGEDGSPRALSDRGDIVFWAETSQFQAVFRSSAVAVPEPGSTTFLVVILGSIIHRFNHERRAMRTLAASGCLRA